MRRYRVLFIMLCCLTWSVAQARSGYVGFGVSYATYTGVVPNYPLPSLQVGTELGDGLELRGTLESLLIVSNIGLDMLYRIDLESDSAWLYTGGGGNMRLYGPYPNGFDLRGVLGGEFPLESDGLPYSLFAEVRLYLRGLLFGFPTLEGRAGINIPF